MSTYLVAFVLCQDYEHIQGQRNPNQTVSVWGPRGVAFSARVSLQYSMSSETFLEKYLNLPSPMPKNDHIYIPNFLSGAMENWGLVTYREGHLLMDPGQSVSVSRKAYMTIAHELAHIWFGNWVTMRTWRDLWLNEGFATFFASLAYVSQAPVSSNETLDVYLMEHRRILAKDGKPKSVPVCPRVVQVSAMFNSYTYGKGMSLLVWLRSIMGEPAFRRGIQAYVHKYSQGNPTTGDFFSVMQHQGPRDPRFRTSLAHFFEPWLSRVGYPVLTVNYDTNTHTLILSQRSVVSNSSLKDTWPIHVTMKTNLAPLDQPLFQLLGAQRSARVNVSLGTQGFVLLNSDGQAYLRVNYSEFMWDQILKALERGDPHLGTSNKVVLLDDALSFMDAGLLNMSVIKALLDSLSSETKSPALWTMFYNRLFSKMYDMFHEDVAFLKWSKYVRTISKGALKEALALNMEGALSEPQEILQKQLIIINCEVDNEKVINFLSQQFLAWIQSPRGKALPKHLITAILYYGLRENDKAEYWNKMYDMMVSDESPGSSTPPVSRDQLAIGLAGTSKASRLIKLLNFVLKTGTHRSDIDKHNFFLNLVAWMLQASNGPHLLRRWILDNTRQIKAHAFGDTVQNYSASTHLDRLVAKIASSTFDIGVVQPLLGLSHKKEAITRNVMNNNNWRANVGRTLLNLL